MLHLKRWKDSSKIYWVILHHKTTIIVECINSGKWWRISHFFIRMKENLADNIQDTTTDGKESGLSTVEVTESPELAGLAEAMQTIQSAVDHDTPVDMTVVDKVRSALSTMTVEISGQPFTLDQLKKVKEIAKNAKIWQEIEDDNFSNTNDLTSLSDKAAVSLSKHQRTLWLNSLTELSDQAAANLAKHRGGLWLNGLTELSDQAAASLADHQGNLWLDGLIELSDQAAASLGNHQGFLVLSGLTELSDQAAASLANHQGRLMLKSELKDKVNSFK